MRYTRGMAIRRFGCVLALVLAVAACKKDSGKGGAGAAQLDKRCESLAKACADTDKHVASFADECKATYKDGVLEVTVSAPKEEERRSKRIQIR